MLKITKNGAKNTIDSIVAHAAMFALLVFAMRNSTLMSTPPASTALQNEVEVTVTIQEPKKFDSELTQRGKKNPKHKQPLIALSALRPAQVSKYNRRASPGESEVNSGSSHDGYGSGRRMRISHESIAAGEAMATTGGGAFPYLRYIRDRLANAIQYPETLIDQRRDGIIAFEVSVDAKGRMTTEPRVSLSGDPGLLTYTRKEITRVMKIPVNKNVRLPGKTTTFIAQFDFRAVIRPDMKSPNIPTIVKNTLYIYPQAVRDPSFLYGGGTQGYEMSVGIDPIKAAKTLKRTL